MTQRIMTGLILLPIVSGALLAGGWWYVLLVLPVAAIAVLEFCALGQSPLVQGSRPVALALTVLVIVAFQVEQPLLGWTSLPIGLGAVFVSRRPRRLSLHHRLTQTAITLAGVIYIAFPAAFLICLRNHQPNGLLWSLVVYTVAASTDTFAYFGGRLLGRTPLAPLLSPGKTVEGAAVGIVGGVVGGLIVLLLAHRVSVPAGLLVLAGALVAVVGDLLESGIKRVFRAKDSRLPGWNLLPGHGGVLDRIDALILVVVLVYLALGSTIG